MKRKIYSILIPVVFLIAFLMPIYFYTFEFGIGLWSDHSKWAEMGSFFSGIYSPIIALLALIILVGQAVSQNRMNKHQYDSTYIQECRKDIDFYIEKMEECLAKETESGCTVQEELNAQFSFLSSDQLNSDEIKEKAQNFSHKYRAVGDIWIAIYPILKGLDQNKEFPYTHNFTGSIMKISTVLSMQSCVALDKVYYSSTTGIDTSKLYFWENKI